MNNLPDIPPEVTGAANLVADWMKRNGHTRWELMEICSRNHAAELEQVQAKLAAVQHRNGLLLLQQAHEESIRAELKHELVALVAERDRLRADLKRAKDSEKCWVENAKNFDAARIKSEQQRNQWQTAAYLCGDALRNTMGHISGEHPHWKAAFKAQDMVEKLVRDTDKKS